MSVDRKYNLRISAIAGTFAPQSEARNLDDTASEKSIAEDFDASNVFERDSGEAIKRPNNVVTGADQRLRAASIPETNGLLSATEAPGEIATRPGKPVATNRLDESPSEIKDDANSSIENRGFAGAGADPQLAIEPSKASLLPDTQTNAAFVNQIKALQSSFQAEAMRRQEVSDMQSAIRQIREMFLEQQRNSVTPRELKRELQTLRLVMEGRK